MVADKCVNNYCAARLSALSQPCTGSDQCQADSSTGVQPYCSFSRVFAVEKGVTAHLIPLGTVLRDMHVKETPALQKPQISVHNQNLFVHPHLNAQTASAVVLGPHVPFDQGTRQELLPTVRSVVSDGRATGSSAYPSSFIVS
jgi:hypothetical protein